MRLQVHLARAAGLLASVAVFGFQLNSAGPAQAVIARTGAGHTVSYQPTVAAAAVAKTLSPLTPRRSVASSHASTYKECASGETTCLTYFGGSVMRTTTVTPVFWNPTGLGLHYAGEYKKEIEQFIADVATDSGKETDFFSILPQYYDELSGTHHVSNSFTAGSPINDTDALPGAEDQCTTPFFGSGRPCVQDKGVRVELEGLIEKDGLKAGIGHEYIVFFPPGMDSCFDGGGTNDENCSGTGYCGYHGTLSEATLNEVEYANEPDNGDPQYTSIFGEACTTKKGLNEAAITISSTSHEISESVTDPEVEEPELSWYDLHKLNEVQYGEIGDMCAYEYSQGETAGALISGKTVVPPGTSNETINGHTYLLQTEWDNSHSTCSLSAEASTPKATFTDTAIPGVHTGESISFDGTGSHGPADPHISNTIKTYEWHWGDGTVTSTSSPTVEHAYASTQGAPVTTFTVELTAIDGNGDEASTTRTVKIEDRSPTAAFSSPAGATAGTPTQFEGSASNDPDGTIEAYEWSFGDGTSGTGAFPSHVYASQGEYTVKLTVTDDAGKTATASHTVTVAAAPAKSSGITVGKTSGIHVTGSKQNKKKGTVALTVSVPGAGVLSAREASAAHGSLVTPLAGALAAPAAYPVALVAAAKGKAKAKGPFVKSVSITVSAAGTVAIQIVPNAAGSALLKSKHKLALKILIAFTPVGGTQGTLVQPVTLVLSPAKKHK